MMIIKNENIAEMKDIVDMLKRTTSIIGMLQGHTEIGADGSELEDISNSLFIVRDRQLEYINALEKELEKISTAE